MRLFTRQRDPVARFESVVLPHLDALFAAAVRMTRDPNDAEDLVQESCLRAYRFLHQLEDEDRSRAWVLQILKNTYINHYRKAERAPRTVELEEDHAVTRQEQRDTLEAVLDDDLKEALDALPQDYRTAVLMADVDGFSYEEIAELLECPVGTVRSRIHRGRGLLRAHLTRTLQRGDRRQRRRPCQD